MTEAVGVHAHPDLKLGRRPKVDKPRLRLGDYLRVDSVAEARRTLPEVPRRFDDLRRVGLSFGLYGNNKFGVCVPTGRANTRRLVTFLLTGTMVAPTQDDVWAVYRSQNPRFDPTKPYGAPGQQDGGMVIQDALAWLTGNGPESMRCLGFGAVDGDDEADVAIAVFGSLLDGADLREAQQDQTDAGLWDYVKGSADWGGHCFLEGSYDQDTDRDGLITWQRYVEMTAAFRGHQVDERYAVIDREMLAVPGFAQVIDLRAFAKDFEELTEKPFPADIPPDPGPQPTPTPTPTPPGGGASFLVADQAVADRVVAAAHRRRMTPDDWLAGHLRTYFHLN